MSTQWVTLTMWEKDEKLEGTTETSSIEQKWVFEINDDAIKCFALVSHYLDEFKSGRLAEKTYDMHKVAVHRPPRQDLLLPESGDAESEK